jgi:ribose transport system substrate-binding protein
MKKILVLLLAMAILMPSGIWAQGKSKTMVFIPKSTSATYYLFLVKGASDKAKELGYQIDYQGTSTEADLAGQVNLVRNVVSSKPAGILLASLDTKALIAPIEEAIKNGVPVVMVDSGVDSDAPNASILTDNYDGGFQSGKLLAKMIGEKGTVANLGIQAGSVSAKRSEGFNDAIKQFPNIKLLPVQWTDADAAKSLNIASDLLTSNPDLNGFFSACAPTAAGIVQALKAKNLDKKVKLVTFDPSPEILSFFEEGVIQAIIAQDPYQMGYKGVEFVDHIIKGAAIKEKNIQIPVYIITPENYKAPETQKLLQTPEKF